MRDGRTQGLATALACLALAGCGEKEETEPAATPATATPTAAATSGVAGPDEKEIEGVVRRYLRALAAPDGAEACSHLTEAGKAATARAGGVPTCDAAVDKAESVLDEATSKLIAEADVTDVKIEGDKATAEIENASTPLELERMSDGKWRISGGIAGG